MNLTGHAWTIWPTAANLLRPIVPPPSEPWSAQVRDPKRGDITLRGSLRHRPESDTCLVIVHGLSGNADSIYCLQAAQAAERANIAHLRLGMRGSDESGQDIYHAGLTDDVQAALQSEPLQRYRHLIVLGYSLGGHIGLRIALNAEPGRVRGVAAICPPLDLSLTAEALNRPEARLYQGVILRGLKRMYSELAKHNSLPTPLEEVLAVRTLRQWDALTVAPRFGFESAEDYYYRMSAGPVLSQIQIPALLVTSDRDPMIPPWTHGELLRRDLPKVTLRRLSSGGHVAFPATQRVDDEAIAWLLARTSDRERTSSSKAARKSNSAL